MATDPWSELREALAAHQKLMSSYQRTDANFRELPRAIRRIAVAADQVTAVTSRGAGDRPEDHSALVLGAMQVIGMAVAGHWLNYYHLQKEPRPFQSMLDNLPTLTRSDA